MSEATQTTNEDTSSDNSNTEEQTRVVRVPEKFTQRFILGCNAEGITVYTPLTDERDATELELVKLIVGTEPQPRGNGGMTREVSVNRAQQQKLYALAANARKYMQNFEKEPSKDHRANTLSAAIGANTLAQRLEKDTVWGVDVPMPYTPKRGKGKNKGTAEADTTADATDGTDTQNDGTDSTDSNVATDGDGDLSSTYERPTLNTADDAEEVSPEDARFIHQDVGGSG